MVNNGTSSPEKVPPGRKASGGSRRLSVSVCWHFPEEAYVVGWLSGKKTDQPTLKDLKIKPDENHVTHIKCSFPHFGALGDPAPAILL